MLTPEQIERIRAIAAEILDPVNEYIIDDIARRIAKTGAITVTTEYLIYRAQTMGVDFDVLMEGVAERLGVATETIEALVDDVARATYEDDARRLNYQVGYDDNPFVQQYTMAAKELVNTQFANVTQTEGLVDTLGREMPLRQFYQQTMDQVFYNVSSGAMDYNTAVRQATAALANKGLTAVGYESGIITSLEAAVRRNIMGGMGLMVERISQQNYNDMGADGWEISAHANSAPDHEPYQGRQYPNDTYQELNGTIKRRIGTLNCGHIAYPIILGFSPPAYTDEYLQQLMDDNAKGITFEGKHYTMYEAKQKLRDIESQRIRKWKRRHVAAGGSGDAESMTAASIRLQLARQDYNRLAKAAGMRTYSNRTYVHGFGVKQAGAVRATQNKAAKYDTLSGVNTNNGITIQSVSIHAKERAVERELSADAIKDALTDPLRTGKIRTDGSQQFTGRTATVSVNPETGKIITVWPTGSKTRKKYGG